MTADEISAGLGDERLQFLHHARFHAADIGDDRAAPKCGKHWLEHFAHPGKGRAENHEVGVLDRLLWIAGRKVHYTEFFALGDARRPADETDDLLGEAALLDRKPQRAAQ